MTVMMFWYGGGWVWWQAALMWLGMIAFWALLIGAACLLITGITRRPGPGGSGGPDGGAPEILDQRLARGEIDAEEYERLRDLLASGAGRSTAGSGSGR